MTQIRFGGILEKSLSPERKYVNSKDRGTAKERSKSKTAGGSSNPRCCTNFDFSRACKIRSAYIFPVAGGAVAAKDKKVETDEIAEVVDEAAAALRELTASSSVSKSVADTQLAAARNVTGRQVHHRNESLQHRRISALIFCMALQAFWVLIRCHAILKYCHSRWVFTAND